MSQVERYEAAVNQTIANCGGDVRDALKALIVANEFLENLVVELDEQARLTTHADARLACEHRDRLGERGGQRAN